MTSSLCPLIVESELPSELSAKWIAPAGEKTDNTTFLARKRFNVDAVPETALLRVAADWRYVVYLNGQEVGLGSARGTHKRYYVDTYDVAALLSEGENHLAVEVHSPVRRSFTAIPIRAMLWLELEGIVATDSAWEVRMDPSRPPHNFEYTFQLGFSECRDLRAEPRGWKTFEDGDAGWEPAVELAGPEGLDSRILTARDIPALTDHPVTPAGVVDVGSVARHPEQLEGCDYADLLQTESRTADDERVENVDALTNGGAARVRPAADGSGAYCIFDFACEVLGSVAIDVEGPEGAVIDLGYAEIPQEDGRLEAWRSTAHFRAQDMAGPSGAYRIADRVILRGGRERIVHRLHDRGMRFIQLVFRRFSEPVIVHSVNVHHRVYPLDVEGDFRCNEDYLNQLWAMCRDTVAVCCMDTFVDCPWREQAFWLNDQLVANLYYLRLTSDRALARHSLRVGADGRLPNGLIPAVYPSAKNMLFPSLSALWTLVLRDYHFHTGDDEALSELLPVMDDCLRIYDEWRDADGLIPNHPDMWNFIDLGYYRAGVEQGGQTAVLNTLVASAYRSAAQLHTCAGNATRAAELEAKSRAALDALNRKLWLPEANHFQDCTAPMKGPMSYSQHPHAIGLCYGLFEGAQRQAAVDVLKDPGAIMAEPYYQRFVMEAMALNGMPDHAMGLVRSLWREMVESGSPTVWEQSTREKEMSYCHAFSCVPLYFMSAFVLGARPLTPGYATFALEPRPLGLTEASGVVPTSHGPIEIAWTASGNTVDLNVTVPKNTTAHLPDGRTLPAGAHTLRLES